MTDKTKWLRGCATALVTPFTSDGAIDEAALARLLEYQLNNGVRLLVPCGTTGESATMTEEEDQRVISRAIELAQGRAKVIAGTGSNATAAAIENSKIAQRLGAEVELLPVPAITFARPCASSIARLMTRWSSSSVIVALSPVVPHGTSNR